MELLDRMKRGSCKGLGCHPDVTTYNTAISAVGKAGRINDALGLLDEMKAARMAPDAITMGSLLNACAQVGATWGLHALFRSN